MSAYAYDIEIDGIFYNELSFIGKKVSVTVSPESKRYSGNLSIPGEVTVDGIIFKVTDIESKAFENCVDLQSINLGANIENIAEGAFTGCTSLSVVAFEDSEVKTYIHPLIYKQNSVGKGAFADCPLDSVYLGRDIDYPFGQPNGDSPFFDNRTLRSVKFGGYATVRKVCFTWNPALKNVDLGNIKIIEESAFSQIPIQKIIFPESLEYIGYQAFQFCSSLKEAIALRKDPMQIDGGAFNSGGYANYNVFKNCTLYVPKGCINTYKTTPGWDKFYYYNEIQPTNITIEREVEIIIGETYKPEISVEPYYAESTEYVWSSSDENVARVDAGGNIVGINKGETVITVSIPETNIKAEINVKVLPILISSIYMNETEVDINFGQQIKLNIEFSPSNASNNVLSWESSNENIVFVNNALITGLSIGSAVITASTTDGSNLSTSCIVNVRQPVTSLSFETSNLTISEDDIMTIHPIILPEDAYNKKLNWSISDESIASIDNGVLKGKKEGFAILTITTTDGTNISAQSVVIVSKTEGINLISTPSSNIVEIYDMTGKKKKEITSGIYIIKTSDGKTYKIKK